MASATFTSRGGTDAEYEVYKALYSTGRKEPADFIFRPPMDIALSFLVNSPRIGIKVGESGDGRDVLEAAQSSVRVETISESDALSDARGVLTAVLGGV